MKGKKTFFVICFIIITVLIGSFARFTKSKREEDY